MSGNCQVGRISSRRTRTTGDIRQITGLVQEKAAAFPDSKLGPASHGGLVAANGCQVSPSRCLREATPWGAFLKGSFGFEVRVTVREISATH